LSATGVTKITVYVREDSTEIEEIDRWENGVGWLAHPDEPGQRVSHAVRGDDGVWILDPIDGPGTDELVERVGDGEVAGVGVCSGFHTRDSEVFARRYGVEIHVPRWMKGVEEKVDSTLVRYEEEPGESGFEVRRCTPFLDWTEAMVYREEDRTLYVPESLGTAPGYTVGKERLGPPPLRRLGPPRSQIEDLDVERLVFGHGKGVTDKPEEALEVCFEGARARLPRSMWEHGGGFLKAVVEVMRG
jgi:hypothetical protein